MVKIIKLYEKVGLHLKKSQMKKLFVFLIVFVLNMFNCVRSINILGSKLLLGINSNFSVMGKIVK